ncbi:diguanylate cyclase [Pandoraea commovens]|uniref:diguanylate cyclase n=1 Tax=Pandoraea commovens TaxID=2508289 RepID=A0A5E4UFL8_9BURK|nr:diguanylate cyclase [Pandoraea commovens]UVA79906.1 diguanylate cyclase [Pandoraea commovens]VVD97654.1 diguanylate cyclase [Pandoraea commovens]
MVSVSQQDSNARADGTLQHRRTGTAASASAAAGVDPAVAGKGKRFVRRIYRLRTIGLGIGFFCVAGVFYRLDPPTPLWLWALVIFHGFVWPHLACVLALSRPVPYRAERTNLMIDAAFGGFWVAAMQFNLLPSVVVLAMMSMDNIGAGGVRLFLQGLLANVVGGLIGIALLGFVWAPASDTFNVITSLPMVILYPVALGKVTYDLAQKLSQRSREMEHLSRHDGLTGLLNRRAWEQRLADIHEHCAHTEQPACLVLMDLDHFKRINDTLGHAAGDSALRRFAGLLRQRLREIDAVGRYGGEEFGAVLVNTGEVAGRDLMHRLLADLRARVAQAEAQMRQDEALRVSLTECTVSIGLVPFSSAFDTPQAWLQQADRALYRAKRQGRDGMVVLEAGAFGMSGAGAAPNREDATGGTDAAGAKDV